MQLFMGGLIPGKKFFQSQFSGSFFCFCGSWTYDFGDFFIEADGVDPMFLGSAKFGGFEA